VLTIRPVSHAGLISGFTFVTYPVKDMSCRCIGR
jgi:hypothetical protein